MENSTPDKKANAYFRIIILSMVIFLIIGLVGFAYYRKSLKAVSKNNSEMIDLKIESGTSTSGITDILYKNHLIRNKLVFKLRVKTSNSLGKLKAGDYKLSQDMSVDEIINQLIVGGKSGDIATFTIPEGYEIKLIADKLSKEKIVDREKFIDLASDKANFENDFKFLKELDEGQSLEGFLFPSTYEIFRDSSEEDIIKKMLEEFEIVYKDIIRDQAEHMESGLNELITMASLVEREARVEGERALIAGVYYNRLAINMKLQCDATVLYALGERKDRVLYKDLEVDSPYNTYKYHGLPIGPISSVGRASIEAALYPEESDYLYYVAKPDGSHAFTKTLAEHEDATEKYLRSNQ